MPADAESTRVKALICRSQCLTTTCCWPLEEEESPLPNASMGE